MHIKFIEVANFRKLLSIRVDLSTETTLFVGANNSGKTSALLALRRSLSPRRCPFEIHDFTICHLPAISRIGDSWVQARSKEEVVDLVVEPWVTSLPSLDLWLHVEPGEMHYVRDLIPTLDWAGGNLGVRLRYEPKDLNLLYKDFMSALGDAEMMRAAAIAAAAAEHPDADPLACRSGSRRLQGAGSTAVAHRAEDRRYHLCAGRIQLRHASGSEGIGVPPRHGDCERRRGARVHVRL